MLDPRSFIGRQLKDDLILDLIERHELKVHYNLDTLHENRPDEYWIEDFAHGMALVADERQMITTCFIYLRPLEGYLAYTGALPGIAPASNTLLGMGAPTLQGTWQEQSWVRFDTPALVTHYSFDQEGPRMLTFMHPSRAP